MAYQLPELPYAHDALEPHIDTQTMEIHHGKHHAAYVTNLNAALDGTEWMDRPIDAVISNLEILPADKQAAVRNNGGGHANHTLFWESLSPNGGGEPMVEAGIKRFGSGWSWLVWDGTGLAVMSTPNQDSPVMEGKTPLFGIDVWEHAYYLKYQNRRPEYLEAIWNVVDWDAIGTRFEAARG
jgi:Fe-Mn family superoxide dismutase